MFVVPIERGNPIRHTPWVVYSLIAVNLLIFVVTIFSFKSDWIYNRFGFVPSEPGIVTAFTSMFLHAGVWHVLGNMFFFWMFGDNIEDVIGPVFFILAYLSCGFVAAGLHYVFNFDSRVPCVGASGAISGVVGIYLTFFPRTKTDLVFYIFHFEIKTITTTAFAAIGAWFIEQTALGLTTHLTGLRSYVPIAFWAHIGGLATGILIGLFFTSLGFRKNYSKKSRRHLIFGYT
jgi:membrane associated rhomboid family serine protease